MVVNLVHKLETQLTHEVRVKYYLLVFIILNSNYRPPDIKNPNYSNYF